MRRTDWLRSKFRKYIDDWNRINPQNQASIDYFLTFDPTKNKKYGHWLLTKFFSGGFLFEDLYKVSETLELFDKHKAFLPAAKRDINRYENLSDLWIAVKKFEQHDSTPTHISNKALKREDAKKARDESIVLIESPDWTIVIPKTEFASNWWGKGTRWCTASKNDNRFDAYNELAPLFIFIDSNGDKYQLFSKDFNYQFMDADDSPVSHKFIEENWDNLKAVFHYLVLISDVFLQYIPPSCITIDLVAKSVSQSGFSLEFVPHKFKTREICEIAVSRFGGAIIDVPADLITQELCLMAAQSRSFDLDSIPDEHRTPELLFIYLKNDGNGLSQLKRSEKTKELCELALLSYPAAIKFVPEEYLDDRMCRSCIEKHPFLIDSIPKSMRTIEFCRIAYASDPSTAQYYPIDVIEALGIDLKNVLSFNLALSQSEQKFYEPSNEEDEVYHWSSTKEFLDFLNTFEENQVIGNFIHI